MSGLDLYELPSLEAVEASENKFGIRSILFWSTVVAAVYIVWTVASPFFDQISNRLSSRVTELRRNSANIILRTADVFTGNSEIVRPRSEDAVLKGDVVYIAEPTSDNIKKRQGLICFSGSSGIAPSNRALADEFAKADYITVIINYWGKHQKIYEKIEDSGPWEMRDPSSEPSERKRASMIKNALDYLRNNRNCTQVGGVGYSGGALPLMNLIQERPCRIEAAFMAHPGRLKTSEYGTIQVPLSLAQTWDDRSVDARTRHEQEKELIDMVISISEEKDAIKSGKLPPKVPWQMNLFSGVEYAFAVRLPSKGRLSRDETYAKRAAFSQAVMWFRTYMPIGEKKLVYDV
ncbi:uncharacterized protein EAE97_006603 [Botrytis byssoidea]|uniref:Dienelactone hydrolase domain-containing protein n=1 Tax=Botrytis byssoidea TaxID=139641 RepID=A0A9P5IMV4_9HELO|nr:uncharacterized protein EAE97_006603 [Botrytis byssoidea]KAF7941766.1 hypothetical protein EAE97_006603 [Botrytis byssoidea]